MTEKNLDARIVANCLDKCVRQDVCYGCAYIDAPGADNGNCINDLMSDACLLLRTQRYSLEQLRLLHASLKKSNVELRKELRQAKEELAFLKEVEVADGMQRNESD